MGKLDWLLRGGATSEEETDYNGFLSYSGEAHSAGLGIAAGFFIMSTGNEQVFSLVLAAISAGLRGESERSFSPILRDVRDEPHYAGGGVVVGAVLGAALAAVSPV